jgi:phage shock protein PspC (stress-responsive transcriptional regulator)
MENKKRLIRTRDDRMLAGVAGGIGKYFDTDPTFVRLLFAVAVFATDGLMILIYIVMAIIVPEEEKVSKKPQAVTEEGGEGGLEDNGGYLETGLSGDTAPVRERPDPAVWAGIGLVLLGLFLLVDRLGWFWWLSRDIIWPLLIVLVGLWMILRRGR